jgi:hypothetical protein
MHCSAVLFAMAVAGFVSTAYAEPASAPDSTTSAAPAAAPAHAPETDSNRIVCRVGPPPTGSRLGGTRECHTQQEWDRIRQEQKNMIERGQTPAGCQIASGCG